MSLQVRSSSDNRYHPVFLSILEDIPGGVTLRTSNLPDSCKELNPGTALNADTTSVGLYNVVKTAKLKRTITTSDCVTIYVCSSSLPNSPGEIFEVGDYVMIDGRGSAATIADISYGTKTNGIGTDTIIFTAGGGGLNATCVTGTVLCEADSAATSGAEVKYEADCLMKQSAKIRTDDDSEQLENIHVGAVVRGSVDESMLPFVTSDESVKTPLTARIRFA